MTRAALIDAIIGDLQRRPEEDLRVIQEMLRLDRLTAAEAGVGVDGTSTALGLAWTDVAAAWRNVAALLKYGEHAVIGGRGRVVRRG